ncbi:hypothetical protein JCM8547_001907 [Rhodosporidiobolus lusitaniae]
MDPYAQQYAYHQQHYVQPQHPHDLQVQADQHHQPGGAAGGGAPVGFATGPQGVQLPPGGAIHLPPSNQTGAGQLPKQLLGSTELVKVTSKSCSNCRSRKVKCDRRYPHCSRCTKRKEECDYGDDVSIALRPTWVGADEAEAALSSVQRPNLDQRSSHPPAANARPPYSGVASSAYPYPPPRAVPHAAYEQSRSIRTISSMQPHGALVRGNGRQGQEEGEDGQEAGFAKLWEGFLNKSNLGASSTDWRLALPTMASSLQVHLLDASMHSCCFHLPAFHAFAHDINFFKGNIDNLDLASQVVVSILASLGARASPHSALLGVAGPDIENGKASLDLVLSAGQRRENAWRAIVNRATELCSKPDILQVPTARNAQTLVAFVQMLMLAEAKPKTARFFLRTAMGVFRDMQHSDLSPDEIKAIKSAVGPTLFESDSRIAAYLSMPVVITDDDLYEYFDGTGVQVPDLATEDLGPLLDDILDPSHGLVTRHKLDRALALTGYFVCSVQRCFSSITSSRRFSNRFLSRIPQLWSYIDRAHAAVQRLHRRLVQLDYVPEGCDAHHSVDYDLLIGVRMDERLLDVVHLAHEWLKAQREQERLSPEDRHALDELLATSERRVRKCLKLLAFYSKVFVDSSDKHNVYHLFTQLEALPDWVQMAVQREGEMTDYEPLAPECALTETELDWFTKALELACFFTPLGHSRLMELREARNARARNPGVGQWQFDLSVPPPAATPGQPQDLSAQLPVPPNPSAGTSRVPSSPGQDGHDSSSSWSFDSYGTPLNFVDNVSPQSAFAQPPGSAGSAGSNDHSPQAQHLPHPQHQNQHYQQQGNGSYDLGQNGCLAPPPPPVSGASYSLNNTVYSHPLPSPTSTLGPGLQQQQHQQQQPQHPSSLDSGLTPSADPSWLNGYDYSAMFSAEANRTGSTPRTSLSQLPLSGGATITELPDDVETVGSSNGMMLPPVPSMAMPAGATPQGWNSYSNGGW